MDNGTMVIVEDGGKKMRVRMWSMLVACAMWIGLISAAIAEAPRPGLAIMPAQYMSADAPSAALVTNELADQFQSHGYSVIPMDKARAEFEAMGLQPGRPYGDDVAAQFGRRLGVGLVVYPQLLAVGRAYGTLASSTNPNESGAVLHIRVVNTHTGQRLYCRQVRQPFPAEAAEAGALVPRAQAAALASSVSGLYFERVAGSREEIRGAP
jgi:hypothetical protein